jgi:molybdopterin converting factor small subunit
LSVVTLTLPASLAALLPEGASQGGRSVPVDADDWQQLTREIRIRFPRLAGRVLTESGDVRTGFLVAVNDALGDPDQPPDLHAGDEVFLIPQIAGG